MDVYDDIEPPYPDKNIAKMVYIGGPCFYLFSEEQRNGSNNRRIASAVFGSTAVACGSQLLRASEIPSTHQMADRIAAQKCFTTVDANFRRIGLQSGVRCPVSTMRQQFCGNDDNRTVGCTNPSNSWCRCSSSESEPNSEEVV
jgi:hypothetical protein